MLRIYRPEPEPEQTPETPVVPAPCGTRGFRDLQGRPVVIAVDNTDGTRAALAVGTEWNCDEEGAKDIAAIVLDDAGVFGFTDEAIAAFAEQVILKLPRDGWELDFREVVRWHDAWFARQEDEGLIWEREAEEEE